jgi:signal transduction histidine kinase
MEQKTEYNLFRITQELINNTLKYADAKNVFYRYCKQDDKIIFMYEDDGKGFDVQSPKKGFGLSNILTRAKALGAEVTFDSNQVQCFRQFRNANYLCLNKNLNCCS